MARLSFAEQLRLDEYKREREAMEAATSVKSNLPAEENERSVQQPSDALQAIQTALINARAAQSAGSGVQPDRRPQHQPEGNQAGELADPRTGQRVVGRP